ncbi:MAG: hypothetical protein RLZZ126_97 [Pseudomonadota bacterium]|jgi:hypothetical protein
MKFNTHLLASLCLAASLGASFGAHAQAPAAGASAPAKNPAATPGIDKQIDNQQKRIDQGVASGQLNKREAARLQAREDKLKADTAAAKADGVVTKDERKALHREANANSRAIARQKHDRQHAKPHN